MKTNSPIILALTAASGLAYGIGTLKFLLENNYKVELVISSKAYYIAKHEHDLELSHNTDLIANKLLEFIDIKTDKLKVWLDDEIWASPSSGSYKTEGMIIAPASMASISAIAHGLSENLITRSADVCLKEKRPLTIVPRETPLNSIHLENMLKLSNMGVNIVPPLIGHYANIKTLDEGINFVVGKILDAHKIENNLYERWQRD